MGRIKGIRPTLGPVLLPGIWDINNTELAKPTKHHFELYCTVLGEETELHAFRALPMTFDMILGLPWLTAENPLIDWDRGIVSERPAKRQKLPEVGRVTEIEEDAEDDTKEGFASMPRLGSLMAAMNLKDKEDLVTIEIPQQYADLARVFSKEEAECLPPRRPGIDHEINLIEGAVLPYGPYYHLSEQESELLNEFLDKGLERGHIQPSNAPCASPLLFVPKAPGVLRLCADFRAVNERTLKNRYPVPTMDDLFLRLRNAVIFTRLDLRSAYHLIRIAEGHEWKTAFRTRRGLFEWRVMPFGLCNAPATFQAFIDSVLRQHIDKYCVVYLDDILIFSSDVKLHTQHVRAVLQSLLDNNLFCKLEKCLFSVDRVVFLGFVITPQGVAMNEQRTETITAWPTPTSTASLVRFLGFCNFYRRFIRHYSRIALPLTQLTKRNTPFIWGEEAQTSFQILKKCFTEAPLLKHFDPNRQRVLETDASGFARSAILSQVFEDGVQHPVAFHSAKFTDAESRWPTHEQELFAIVDAFKVWRHFLIGTAEPVEVITDHDNLKHFLTMRILSRKQARWAEYLSQFHFCIKHRPGKRNPADGPSRRDDYKSQQRPENTLAQLLQVGITQCTEGRRYSRMLLQDMSTDQDQGQDISLWDRIKHSYNEETKTVVQAWPEVHWDEKDGVFYHDRTKVCIPTEELQLIILREFHDSRAGGHWGKDSTIERIRRWAFWPGLASMVADYIRGCPACQRAKTAQIHYGVPTALPVPDRPWDHIAVDFISGLPESVNSSGLSCSMILVFVDRFSRMGHFVACAAETDTRTFAQLYVENVFRLHGMQKSIVSDRGSLFTSSFWTTLAEALDVNHRLSTAFHPQTDGATERLNQTLEQYLRIFTNWRQNNWARLLAIAEYAYNDSRRAATGVSPFFACYGRHPKPPGLTEIPVDGDTDATQFAQDLQKLHGELVEHLLLLQDQALEKSPGKPIEFAIGDKVLLDTRHLRTDRPSKKLDSKRRGPFEVLAKVGPQAYRLKLPPLYRIHPVFHVSLLSPWKQNELHTEPEPEPPVQVSDNTGQHEEWEVDEILDAKGRDRTLKYLVKWRGYGHHENTWEPARHVENAPEAVRQYWVSAGKMAHAPEAVRRFHSEHPFAPSPMPDS
ncbi:hypothetical protein DTO282F9_8888 [Paecilomyces variotii]|nr:hypothetical protein DTO282F9_8888 [Paecilomyces variotii]